MSCKEEKGKHGSLEYVADKDNCWYYDHQSGDIDLLEFKYCPECGIKLEKPDA